MKKTTFILIAVVALIAQTAFSQTTDFVYQGSLRSGGSPANGIYDFEFAVFDSAAFGNQIGSTVSVTALQVTNGVFSATLNVGNDFPGAQRFIEIRVRQTGGGAFTTLTPRQSITSAPYSITSGFSNQSVNAVQLGGVSASNYVQTTDPRMTDARTPLAGSSNYIQNSNSTQSSSNFNISGNGTVGGTLTGGTVAATTQFNLGGVRYLSNPGTSNLFLGVNAGGTTNSGSSNIFIGDTAGERNTVGFGNVFAGQNSGTQNTAGGGNTFIGRSAGSSNSTGDFSTYVGYQSGRDSSGNANSFFGSSSGLFNTSGINNAFFGANAGNANVTGGNNTFIGRTTGLANVGGSNNTLLGSQTNVGADGLTYATAIGSGAVVLTSNTVTLGRANDTVVAPNLLVLGTLGAAGTTQLCRNTNNQIATCLLPAPSPLNETQTKEIKDQQETINRQQKEIEALRREMEAMKAFICSQNPSALVCGVVK